MSLAKQDITNHPCKFPNHAALSHRAGGFGDTCERCGTPIAGPNNEPTEGFVSWEPVQAPQPYEPGSLNAAIYKLTHSIAMTDMIIDLIED